jgi:hypothetical protein
MNIIADLPSLKTAFSTLKQYKDEDSYTIEQANHHYLQEVYNQFPLRIEGYNILYQRT